MKSFNVIALNKNYEIVSLLRFTNLQWNRKYHESGNFSIQIPLKQYSSDIKYIYTKDRTEMGKVTQRNFVNQNGYSYMQLSGYFLEKELDRHVVFPYGTSNVTNAPSWVYQSGKAEAVAYAYFNGFKEMTTESVSSDLGIAAGTSQGRGKDSVHYRNGEYLGYKIYDILKPSGMSYRVLYDFVNSEKKFEVWTGLDRTEENTDGNNPVVFSTKYGNIKNPNVLIDETEYKNACIVINEQSVDGVSSYISRVVFLAEEGEDSFQFLREQSILNRDDYTESDFKTALCNEGINALGNAVKIINVEFDAMEGSYEYMEDFDIGDLCNIEIPEIDLSAQARLIGCYEVMKSGQWTMTMEFGTPIIIKK